MNLRFLIPLAATLICTHSEAAMLGEIAKDSAGDAILMNYDQAVRYCEDQNSRLPTIREYAEFSQSSGAKGILEPSDFNGQSGYLPVYRQVDPGRVIDFYFNLAGYKIPQDAASRKSFWSSSSVLDGSSFEWIYDFSGDSGAVSFVMSRKYGLLAVRCMVVHK